MVANLALPVGAWALAQSVERISDKDEVPGSNPGSPTIFHRGSGESVNHTASVQRSGQSSTEADSHRRLSLLLVDDTSSFEGVRRLLAPSGDIVVVGGRRHQALGWSTGDDPTWCSWTSRCGMDGIQATKRMVRRLPTSRIVMFTHAEQELLMEALDSGADGFV